MRLLLTSPVGPLLVDYDAGGVRVVRYRAQGEYPPAGTRDEPARDDVLGQEIVRQLQGYFSGKLRKFDLPISSRGTPFQERVWAALQHIPFGETRTYAQIATEIGSPGASQAVGQANRSNAIPIIIPCHRVIASGGALGGYAGATSGSGVETKRWLLRHEGGRF